MADSLIGYLNQQIQKANRAQEQQQSTSTDTKSTNANTLYSSENPPNTTDIQPSILTSLEGQQINSGQPQNIYIQQSFVPECVSLSEGLGISGNQPGSNNTVVNTATNFSSGNVFSVRGGNIYSSSVGNRNESTPSQQQPLTAQVQLSTPLTTTQSNKQINMSSSGIMLISHTIITFKL